MNIEEMIHDRWENTAALNNLLDVSRLKTGENLGVDEARNEEETNEGPPVLPFCIVDFDGAPHKVCNCGDGIDAVGVVFQLFHPTHATAKAIAEQIRACYHRSRFSLSDGRSVMNMRRRDNAAFPEPDGVWRFVEGFEAKVYLSAGY